LQNKNLYKYTKNEKHNKSMEPRTKGAIALRPFGN